MDHAEGGVRRMGRAEIDTRTPFRSVREAVMLFGERVLVGQVYAHKLKETQSSGVSAEKGNSPSKLQAVTTELEEARQSLERAREEGNAIANCLKSMREELEQTKRELRHLKSSRNLFEKPLDPEIEDLKFVENNDAKSLTKEAAAAAAAEAELQKKRYVSFASPPSLTRVIVRGNDDGISPTYNKVKPETANSSQQREKKKEKKLLGTLIRKIFHQKRT